MSISCLFYDKTWSHIVIMSVHLLVVSPWSVRLHLGYVKSSSLLVNDLFVLLFVLRKYGSRYCWSRKMDGLMCHSTNFGASLVQDATPVVHWLKCWLTYPRVDISILHLSLLNINYLTYNSGPKWANWKIVFTIIPHNTLPCFYDVGPPNVLNWLFHPIQFLW